MIKVEHQHSAPIVCESLKKAVRFLIYGANANMGPSVTIDGKVVIEQTQRYIDGDCYVPSGYVGLTNEAKAELQRAYAMRAIGYIIDRRATGANIAITKRVRALRRITFTSTGKLRALAI